MSDPFERREFTINRRDAERILDGLELAASWDKTEIYYQLKDWLKEDRNDASHS